MLILGSMPGIVSLDADEYYGHPRNSFWWIMSQILDFDLEHSNYQQRCEHLRQNHIALWDVIYQCQRKGSLDSAIDKKSLVPNDFETFLDVNKNIHTILCNGTAAYDLFLKHVAKPLQLKHRVIKLPSTSPAHASMNKEEKLSAWKNALSR